jgi:hypothetical protein
MPIGVIPKFTQGKPLGPLTRMGTDETSQITFHLLVDMLGLARLREIGRTHLKLYARALKQCLPKGTSKNRVSI